MTESALGHRLRDRRAAWIVALLATITIAVFAPSLLNGFVAWDDETNFVKNPSYRGLGPSQLRWMFTTTLMGHWIPLTWLTLGLDYVLWGMNPLGYHLTNVLIHAITVALAYLVALRLLGTSPWEQGTRHAAAVVAALFFGLHPLRAESVAWVTERRDVLSGALFLLAILLYLRAHDAARARRRLLGLSLAAFGLAIASKAIVMTLPAVLLVLDVYPLRRFWLARSEWPAARAVLIEKIPYAVLGVIGAGLGYYGQLSNDFFTPFERYSLPARIALSLYSYWFYLWKTVMPTGLGPLYELPPSVDFLEPRFLGAGLAVCAITALVILVRRRLPILATAWACYVITLAPVCGIAHAGFQLTNDRYSYLPSLGLSMLVGAGFGALVRRRAAVRATVRHAAGAAVVALLVLLAFLTWQQVQIWRNTDTLWTYAVDAEPSCAICRTNYGMWLMGHGNPAGGAEQLKAALTVRPDWNKVHGALGIALVQTGHIDEALVHLEQRLAVDPDDVDVLLGIAVAHLRAKRPAEAQAPLARAMALQPANPLVRVNHATMLRELNRRDESLAEYRRALEMDQTSASARYAYGWTLVKYGDRAAAMEQIRRLEPLDPKLAAELAAELARQRSRP